jgi:anti-sigma B factor antagonist
MAEYDCLDVSEVGDVTVARLRDPKMMDGDNLRKLGRELLQLVEVDQCKKLLLDLSAVEFLTSAGLGKLIVLSQKAAKHGCTLKLSNIRPEIHKVFAFMKLDGLFDIKKDEADALASF